MKKRFLFVAAALIALLVLFWQLVLPIPTGYAAKMMCSCHCVCGFDEELVRQSSG